MRRAPVIGDKIMITPGAPYGITKVGSKGVVESIIARPSYVRVRFYELTGRLPSGIGGNPRYDIDLKYAELLGEPDAKYAKRKKLEKRMIKISDKVFEKMVGVLTTMKKKPEYPYIYLNGVNSRDVLVHLEQVKHKGGCSFMPPVSDDEIAGGLVRLAKQKLIPYGITRVGRFDTLHEHKDRGSAVYDIGMYGHGAYMVSANYKGILVEAYDTTNGEIIHYDYGIVRAKRRRRLFGGSEDKDRESPRKEEVPHVQESHPERSTVRVVPIGMGTITGEW